MQIDMMAYVLGRTVESVKHALRTRRDVFPRRRMERKSQRNDVEFIDFKFSMSKYIHSRLRAEAKRRNVSMNMIIREILREALITDGNSRKARGPGVSGVCGFEREEETLLP